MRVVQLSRGHYFNLDKVRHFQVYRPFADDGWQIKGDDTVLFGGIRSQAEAEATLATFLSDIATVVLRD